MVNRNIRHVEPGKACRGCDLVRAELASVWLRRALGRHARHGRRRHIFATPLGGAMALQAHLLIGHLDTVFEPDSPFPPSPAPAIAQGPRRRLQGRRRVLIAACCDAGGGTLRDSRIMLGITGDRKGSGAPIAVASPRLIEAGRWADVVSLNRESGHRGRRDFGTVSRRSETSWTAHHPWHRSGHSSGVFGGELGFGAIYEIRASDRLPARDFPSPISPTCRRDRRGTPPTIDCEACA